MAQRIFRGFELTEFKVRSHKNNRNTLTVTEQRIVLLDCDMIVRKNMDELMTIELPHDHIAAVHVCACNPRGIEHYPNDWSGLSFSFQNFLTFIFT